MEILHLILVTLSVELCYIFLSLRLYLNSVNVYCIFVSFTTLQ
jgi:hypothetical protein